MTLKLDNSNIKNLWKTFYLNPKKEQEKFITFWVKYREEKKVKMLKITSSFFKKEKNILSVKKDKIEEFENILRENFNLPLILTEEEKKEYNKIKNDKRIQKTYEFIKNELPEIITKTQKEEFLKFNPEHNGKIHNEESTYRELGKIYSFSYIQKRFKELIYFYKKDENKKVNPFPLKKEEKEKIKKFLILCNMGIVLKVLEGIIPRKEREGLDIGEYVAEGMLAVTESIEKFEIDFTAEKATKNTKIHFIEITENNEIKAEIIGNKPFSNIDIEISIPEEDIKENINIELKWKEMEENGLYKSDVLITNLENDYTDYEKVKLSVSKRVGHPSTFITTNTFFAIKNLLAKKDLLKVSNNHYILQKQITKIGKQYEEKYNKEPSNRWLAYYLLIQKGIIKRETKKVYDLYKKKQEKKKLTKEEQQKIKDLEVFLRKDNGKYLFLTENKNRKRLLMIKTKEVKDKNKNNYQSLDNIGENIDEYLYSEEFENLLYKKEKEIRKAKLFSAGTVSLDQEVESQENKTLGDFLGTTDSLDLVLDTFESNFYQEVFINKMKKILNPREFFYLGLYFLKKMNLEDLATLGFYSNGTTESRKVVKTAIAKIMFYSKYKTLHY